MTGRRETLSRLQARHEAKGFPLPLKACRRQAVTRPDAPIPPVGINALVIKFAICSHAAMERIERQELSAILLAAPGWARVGLTMPDERMRERAAARRCHRIVSVADAMTRQALAAGIGRPEQYVTICSGIEVERFLRPQRGREEVRRCLGIGAGEFVLGTVGRLAEFKGHDDLLVALGPVMRQRKGLRLLWVGDGWRRERLLARVRSMGLEGRVVTTGAKTVSMSS